MITFDTPNKKITARSVELTVVYSISAFDPITPPTTAPEIIPTSPPRAPRNSPIAVPVKVFLARASCFLTFDKGAFFLLCQLLEVRVAVIHLSRLQELQAA